MPVRVEGQRHAVRQHMRLAAPQIGLRRLRRREMQRRQTAGGVVDEHDQRAARPRAPRTNHAGCRRSGSVRQTGAGARAAETPASAARRLAASKPNRSAAAEPSRATPRSLQLGQLLRRQRRAKVRCTCQLKVLLSSPATRREPSRRNPAALACDIKPRVALLPPRPNKPLDLPNAYRNPLAATRRRKLLGRNLPNHMRHDSAHQRSSPKYPPPKSPLRKTSKRGHSHSAKRGHSHVALTTVLQVRELNRSRGRPPRSEMGAYC